MCMHTVGCRWVEKTNLEELADTYESETEGGVEFYARLLSSLNADVLYHSRLETTPLGIPSFLLLVTHASSKYLLCRSYLRLICRCQKVVLYKVILLRVKLTCAA